MAEPVRVDSNSSQNLVNLEAKREQITDKLQQRDNERIQELQKRKEDREKTAAAGENTEYFVEHFSSEKDKIESELNRCENEVIPKNELSEYFDSLVLQAEKLQKFVADSVLFLPDYEVRNAQGIIKKMLASIQEKRDELQPKKKFAFKSKKKATDKTDSAPKQKGTNEFRVDVKMNECGYSDLEGQNLSMGSAEILGKDVALARLKDCTVKLYGSPSAVHIDKLSNCKVFCGPVPGSIFIDNCVNCTFVLSCQQLRIHTTTDTHFYIHVTSKAIIEDCSRVEFAPYNWTFEGLNELYKTSGLDANRNNWSDVDDFNWLASDKHSPNWSILPEEKRVEKWN